MRPRTLGQELNTLTYPLIPFDEENVAFTNIALELRQVVRDVQSVARNWLG